MEVTSPTIIIKQHGKHTTITLKEPTTEINIFPNIMLNCISQDALGRVHMNIKHRGYAKLDDFKGSECSVRT